jgi:hypothetical protein
MRRLAHGVSLCLLGSQPKRRRSRGDHVDPQNGDRAEREDTPRLFVLESQTDDENDNFRNVDSEGVNNEPLDVGEESTTFANCDSDRIKVAKVGRR